MTASPTASPPQHASRWSALWLLTLLLLLASVARIHHLMQQSLWLDESYTYRVIVDLGPLGAATDDMHPPLYYLALAGWMALTGDSVLAMRLFSALCAILTVPLVYQLARQTVPRTLPQRRAVTAGIALLLFALADADIFMAQEIRNYAFHKLLLVGMALAYLHWAQRPTRRRFALWVGLSIANLYTYYLSGLLLAAVGLHALRYLPTRLNRRVIGGLVLTGLSFLPWFFTGFLSQLRTPNPLFLPEALNAHAWREFLRLYFSNHWALIIGLMVLGALPLTTNRTRPRWQPDGPALLLILWAALPFAFIAIIGLFRPFFSPRWPFMVTPAIALLAARGLSRLQPPDRSVLLAAIVVFSVTTVDFYRPKPPWNQVAERVLRYAAPGDSVLMEINNADYSVGYYLEHGLPPDVPFHSLRIWRDETDDREYSLRLQSFLSEQTTVWLVAWGADHDIFNQLAQAGFVRTFTQSVDHQGNLITVNRYDRPPEGAPATRFESGLVLHRAVFDPARGRVDLWWSVDAPVALDYTTSTFLLDAGGMLVTQHDTFPAEGTRPTTTWQPGELIYDPHFLDTNQPAGAYSLGVQTYYWADGAKIPTQAGEPWFTVGTYTLPAGAD
ncbi:MAG: hypothetical protein Kow0077_20210 [Anaerolineae bacterium]